MSKGEEPQALIFDLQGFSVHDGPGCRTLIFFKGCPLNCFWCSNPEGIAPRPVLLYYESRCQCKQLRCAQYCSQGAITGDCGNGYKPHFARHLCASCQTFDCLQGCYFDALRICGRKYTFSEVIALIERDSYFWGERGGITLGGGEPLLQPDFINHLLCYCQQNQIHTAIETSAAVDNKTFLKIIRLVDWVFVDLKHIDPEKHRQATGKDNRQILQNIMALKEYVLTKRIIVRIPLIVGFNTDRQNLNATINFLKTVGLGEVNLLPLHHLGESKYHQLGLNYTAAKFCAPNSLQFAEIEQLFRKAGLKAYSGAQTPF